MSKLDELISELCPDGVEYIAIGDVVKYEQPTKYIVNSIEYNNFYYSCTYCWAIIYIRVYQ